VFNPAANRDPEKFERPDEVILDRRNNQHLAFGVGIHRCVGAPLGRMELQVGLRAFLRSTRYPDFSIAEGTEVTYNSGQVSGPAEMMIHLDTGR
jgi:cytochrome P450